MPQDIWEGVNRQKIYEHFSIDPENIFDSHLITMFGYYTPELYPIMKEVQRRVLQNRYFIGMVCEYDPIEVKDRFGEVRKEAQSEKSFRYLRNSELAIFLLLLQDGHKPPASGVTIEAMKALEEGLWPKCIFLYEGDINIHFDTGLITTHPEYQRSIKIEEISSKDIEGIAQIIVAKCKAFYFK